MKYCIQFDNRNKHIDNVDEIIIGWHGTDFRVTDFIKAHPNQRTIIYVAAEHQDPLLATVLQGLIHELPYDEYNWAVSFELPLWRTKLNIDIPKGLKFFYGRAPLNWDEFALWVAAGVSDIYVGNEMGFEIKRVAAAVEDLPIQIRVIPNLAQAYGNELDIRSFYIRPEDVFRYEGLIDVLEFYENQDISFTNSSVLYEIYTRGKWGGSINAIIMGLKDNIPNAQLPDLFGSRRTRCNKECIKGRNCTVCTTSASLAKSMQTWAQTLGNTAEEIIKQLAKANQN